MNARNTITTLVDEMIGKGLITTDQKESYVQSLGANDQLAEYFAGQMLRQSDYTKKTMELANQRREFDSQRDAEWQKVQAERANLAQWERDTKAEIDRLRGLEGTVFAQTAKLASMQQVLADYNLMDQLPAELRDVSTNPSLPTPTQQYAASPAATTQEDPMSNANFLSRDEATQAMQDILRLQSTGMRIAGLHQQIFGQPLTDDIISEALQSNIPPAQLESYWRTKYAVDAREATMREEKQRAELEALKAQVRQEMMTEFATDPSRLMTGNPSAPRPVGSVLEHYAASRAAATNPIAGATPTTPTSLERQPELQLHASRVNEAADYFRQNFSPDGTPIKGDTRLTS